MTAFATPVDAVRELSRLLAARDWAALRDCYQDAPADLQFYDPGRSGHPGGFDAWLRPFPPGWSYLSHEEQGDLAVVRVGIAIDQGDGMVQRGFREFRMRRTPAGWQVLIK